MQPSLEIFAFHPQLHPPPAMTPSSGRASPTRARYVALDAPGWLRWDDAAFEFRGTPAREDMGSAQVQVVERLRGREAGDLARGEG